MKLVKLSVVALALGLFAASCGSNEGTTEGTDTTTAPAVEPMPETPAAPVTPADSNAAPKADSPVAPATTPAPEAAPEAKK